MKPVVEPIFITVEKQLIISKNGISITQTTGLDIEFLGHLSNWTSVFTIA